MIHTSIAGLIGNTPLLKLSKIGAQNGNELYAKCEFQNPAGGIKDRIALHCSKNSKKAELSAIKQISFAPQLEIQDLRLPLLVWS